MSPLRKLAIGLWVAVFLAGGLWLGARWQADPEPATAAAAPAPRRVPVKLPPITLPDLKGTPRSLAEWQGRTLLINFWATWCAPCRKEMPLLEALQQAADPSRLQVLGIAIDRRDPVLRFVGEAGVTYPVLVGEADATAAAEQFGEAFAALPFSVIAGPDGSILATHTGELDGEDLRVVAEVADQLAAGALPAAGARARLARQLAGPAP